MSPLPIRNRWNYAVTQAAGQVLAARWRSTLEALDRARAEYGQLHAASTIDVRAVRKAAQRVHELEQLRAVLACELIPAR
ncbi:MAG: hypothetical protein JSS29_14630 [Proteobacteria bacterium]|nr:hypothetical protein [Pseudomonadota bacterium]